MKSKLILLGILTTISVFLLACASAPKETSVEVACDDFYNTRHISKAIEVNTGDTFTVTLCANPTTGFQWVELAQISDAAVLKQEDYKFSSPESQPAPPPGTPGQSIWTFKTLQKGSSTVAMEYSRPWEGGEKGEWTFILTVVVK